jgi:uncharacterized membrane protein
VSLTDIGKGESRWPAALAILAAIIAVIGMQVTLPSRLTSYPRWLLPALEVLLLVGPFVANPRQLERQSPLLRRARLISITVVAVANAWLAGWLMGGLILGSKGLGAGALLATGVMIWWVNVIVFALWYWEIERDRPHLDFLFPQMQNPRCAPDDWKPAFTDYLYLSYTNATAFGPTDVLPLSCWAKLTMMLQSAVSFSTIALIIARAVNNLA